MIFRSIRIGNDALYWTHPHALGLVVMADTLGAVIGVDPVNRFAFGNGPIRAFGLANVAVDAFVGNQ
jgi:hypothetical protein